MPNISSFGAQTENAVVQGTVTDRQMIIPEVPPQGLMSVGPRVSLNLIEEPWNEQTSYVYYDVVRDDKGASYIAYKPIVPTGTPLTDTDYWFLWAEPNAQLAELKRVVETYNQRITNIENDITNKAPINHASEETIYGIGNGVNYGHLRLATDDTPATSDANAGIAATPKMVNSLKKKDNVGCTAYISNMNNLETQANIYAKANMRNIILYTEYDNGEFNPNIESLKVIKDSITSKNIECDTIKIHKIPSADNLSAYENAVNTLADSLKIKNVIILNECGYDYIINNANTIESIVTNMKATGKNVSISANANTAMGLETNEALLNALSFISFNLYPSAGYSYAPNNQILIENALNEYAKIASEITFKQPNKQVWITEIGIINKPCFLYKPEQYDTDNGYPLNSIVGRTDNDRILIDYDLCVIDALASKVDRFYLWYSNEFTEHSAEKIGAR